MHPQTVRPGPDRYMGPEPRGGLARLGVVTGSNMSSMRLPCPRGFLDRKPGPRCGFPLLMSRQLGFSQSSMRRIPFVILGE